MIGRRLLAPLAGRAIALTGCQPPAPASRQEQADTPFYPATNRPDVRGTHGALSSDHPLATQAGMDVLKQGGNAVDAAVAMAAVLAVVRPHMNGVGGDAFIMVYEGASGTVTALNGGGRAMERR